MRELYQMMRDELMRDELMDEQYRRIEVWKHTQLVADEYPSPQPSIKYKELPLTKHVANFPRTEVFVVQQDAIDAAIGQRMKGNTVVLLNMADPFIPGGIVHIGGNAQEECIFRRTNYHKTLKYDPTLYPIINHEAIYSADVTIFKKSDYNMIDGIMINMIACPSLRKSEFDIEIQEKKIEMIFNTALYHGNDTLILSAFGCGVFRCDPKIVAELFNRVIQKYNRCFRTIVFAILHSSENLEVFKSVIGE